VQHHCGLRHIRKLLTRRFEFFRYWKNKSGAAVEQYRISGIYKLKKNVIQLGGKYFSILSLKLVYP
jgi:hypothetical protein